MKKFLFFALSLGFLLPAHAQDSTYHIADIQVMYDVMRNNPNTSAELLYRNRHHEISTDINIFHRFGKGNNSELDAYPKTSFGEASD